MASSKYFVLQKAVKNLRDNKLFRNRWVNQKSFLEALVLSYPFDEQYTINQKNLGRAIGLMGNPDDLHAKNPEGVHRNVKGVQKYLFFQNPDVTPPKWPDPKVEIDEWKETEEQDVQKLARHVEQEKNGKARAEQMALRRGVRKRSEVEVTIDLEKKKKKTEEQIAKAGRALNSDCSIF